MWHVQASTRTNGVAPPSYTVSPIRITFAWLLDSARRHLKAFVKPTDPPNVRTSAREKKSGAGYTMLGISEVDGPRRHQ